MTSKGMKEMEVCLKEARELKSSIDRLRVILRGLKRGDSICLLIGEMDAVSLSEWSRERLIAMFEDGAAGLQKDWRKLQPKIHSKVG